MYFVITRSFSTLAEAEEHQEMLQGMYSSVECIRSPLASEEGIYAWRVKR